ncbi:MAG: PQQ-dependent sugar dehydrogenase, partial [Actinobacteria bacterium]|nr:PQQ-dependent sugar dehydrogenase [Actinomycetota bacterium]
MRWGSFVVLLAALAFATSSGAAEPNALELEFVTTASSPVYVTAPPGDTSRLFIVQQGSGGSALIRLLRDGGPATTFLNVSNITTGGERGLLSMAFPPTYATSGKFYVYYTASDGAMTVAEYMRDATNPDIADPNSRRVVISIPHPNYSNHNGGQLQFGPDGYLYLATGDGGGGGDPDRAGQNLAVLPGKLLRINPNLGPFGEPYTVPADNPFVGQTGVRPEIWAYGLRNPWRFSFDRQTGDLTIGDVGQGAWEEIDFALAPNAGRGMNFGWSCLEGRHLFGNCSEPSNHVPPVWEYSHPSGCSITGGYVVRDPAVPSLFGRYVYTDYCTSGGAFGLRSVMLAIPDAAGDSPTGLT